MTKEQEIEYFLESETPKYECDIFDMFIYGKRLLSYKECHKEEIKKEIEIKLEELSSILFEYSQKI